ncbi:MAG TPA: carbohydrate kinase family protein [Candidatus Altiarchaeales archaeon]|nr:carbohydrate kinase family protein [Candidatus Altiarchaeales archaeon]
MKIEVTSVGDVNVDIITSNIREMPGHDSQIIINNIFMSSGGCAANFAKAITKLGLKVRLIGKIGKDLFRDFLIRELEGVDLKLCTANKTGLTVAITFEDNSRSFITYPGGNGELTIEDIDLNLIEGKYLHIPSFFLQGLRERVVDLIKYGHEKNMIVSFDTGWDPAGWSRDDKKLVRKILKGVDIFFPNIREASAITGLENKEEICEDLLNLGIDIVALKMGPSGSYIAKEEDRIFIPAYRVKAIDTTGAGDVFNAAFVFCHSRDWDLEKSGRFASGAAAISTIGYGSERYPSEEDVQKFMKS